MKKIFTLLALLMLNATLFFSNVSAQTGSALDFDGIDDYIRTSAPFYSYTNGITVEAWINTTQSVWIGSVYP